MSVLISCQCGTKLRVDESAAGKTVACPKCKKLLKVPGGAAATPVAAKPAAATAAATITLTCRCGQRMKVAAKHAGKTVACPKCNSQLVVPGGQTPAAAPAVTPVQPVRAPVQPVRAPVQPVRAPVQPVRAPVQPAQQPLPDFFSTPAGAAPVGGLKPYTPPAAAPRAGSRKTPKSGPISTPGMLIALIGVCIIGGGLLFSGIGQATMHLLIHRATSGRVTLDFRSSMQERRAAMEAARSRAESSQSMQTFMKVTLKIGRTVIVLGTITAVVGYGMCIMSPGAQMGLAIAALAFGVVSAVLDLIMRTVPYLAENDVPRDIIMVRASVFDTFSSATVMPLLLEFLMVGHLLLFSIFALVAMNRRGKGTAALPISALSLFAVYLVVIFVVSIMMGSSKGLNATSMMWTTFGIHWVANVCLAIGLGFLIASIVQLRTK